MRKIKVSELKPGMIFDQPVFIDPSNILVQAKQEILAKDIERLIKWGIKEVETSGVMVKTENPAVAESTAAKLPPMRSNSPVSSPEKLKIHSDYESMRKSKHAFRSLIKEGTEILQNNIYALMEAKPFDNHALINIAQRIVDEVTQKNYMLLSFQGIKSFGDPIAFHSIQAACYGVSLAFTLNYTRPRMTELVFSMLLMDVGMWKVPVHIKEKIAKLNDSELQSIKTHPLLGYQTLIKNGKVKATLATIALQHHEAFDGSGYPQGLKMGQIEEGARIAAIADCYTAMIEKRPYRSAMSPYDAMKSMLSVQMNRYDPKLLRTFLGRLSIYPIGSLVQLSNNRIGVVLSCKSDKPLRPMIRLMRDENGLPYSGLTFMDLIIETDVYIIKALDPANTGIDLDSEI